MQQRRVNSLTNLQSVVTKSVEETVQEDVVVPVSLVVEANVSTGHRAGKALVAAVKENDIGKALKVKKNNKEEVSCVC
jgi:hypothetical protein